MLADPRTQVAQFLRFLVSGGSGFLIYLVFALLLRAGGLSPPVSAWLATILAIVPTFLLQRQFTFRDKGPVAAQFMRYAALQVVIAFVIATSARALTSWGAPDWFGFLVAGAVGVSASYIIQALLVFRRV